MPVNIFSRAWPAPTGAQPKILRTSYRIIVVLTKYVVPQIKKPYLAVGLIAPVGATTILFITVTLSSREGSGVRQLRQKLSCAAARP